MKVTDPVYQRIRKACCEESARNVNLDDHARHIYSIVVKAKANPRRAA